MHLQNFLPEYSLPPSWLTEVDEIFSTTKLYLLWSQFTQQGQYQGGDF